ncbi:MAG: hypothetical protein LBM23_01530 [Propionibacteriaceae bacterium]|jgi:hypothetical protein|nr:hypothetical protein [Propionibacteriaceae bacterium]
MSDFGIAETFGWHDESGFQIDRGHDSLPPAGPDDSETTTADSPASPDSPDDHEAPQAVRDEEALLDAVVGLGGERHADDLAVLRSKVEEWYDATDGVMNTKRQR